MQKKKVLSLLTVFMFMGLFIVAGPSDKHFINGEKWVSEDYNPTNTTLLIKKFSYTYTYKGKTGVAYEKEETKLEKYMKESYPYAYEFTDNLSDEKYADKEKFRYVIDWGSNTTTYTSGTPISGINCYVTDRKLGPWKSSGRGTSYAIGVFSMTINTMVFIYQERNKK